MSKTTLTRHAKIRCAQRAIPEFHLELLRFFGEITEQKNGCYTLSLSSEEQNNLREDLTYVISHWDQFISTYAIFSNSGVIITAGHKYKKRICRYTRRAKNKESSKWRRYQSDYNTDNPMTFNTTYG
jgi:hypothetical protein